MTKNSEMLVESWDKTLNVKGVPEIKDMGLKRLTARLLENQKNWNRANRGVLSQLDEGMGESQDIEGGMNEATPTNVSANAAQWDPILINMVRRAAPALLPAALFGTQPMSGPVGLIFARTAHYNNANGQEALHDYVDSSFSGENAQPDDPLTTGTDESTGATLDDPFSDLYSYGRGQSMIEGNINPEMALRIEKMSITARERALKGTYSIELAQDMQALHGLSADSELINDLSDELTLEINREMIRRALVVAKLGAAGATTPGTIDLETDSSGRWNGEKFFGLRFFLELESNRIMYETRRGRATWVVCSANVASALAMSGILDTSNRIQSTSISSDFTSNVYAGKIGGNLDCYIDPFTTTKDFVLLGYKGPTSKDAGIYYAPYVPFQVIRAQDQDSGQPIIFFKTRYAVTQNPFVRNGAGQQDGEAFTPLSNPYYRKFAVTNIKG